MNLGRKPGRLRIRKIHWGVIVCVGMTSIAAACENAVRDAAFRGPRDLHRLCLITATDDDAAAAERQRLTDWLAGPAAGLNLELAHLCADDPNVQWSAYGIPSAPPTLPVVALIGKNYGTSESFVIDHWEPAPTDNELAAVLDSPVRQQLQQMLGKSLAVVVYAPGEEFDEQKFQTMFAAVRSTWLAKDLPPMEFVRLDRHDERERTLVSFMGLHPDGPSMVGVIFGRGKLMSPPLIGPAISRKRINELVDQIYQDCNCSKPLPSLGVDLPFIWNEELAQTFVPVSDPSDKPVDPRLAKMPGVESFTDPVAQLNDADANADAAAPLLPSPPLKHVPSTTRSSNQLLRIVLATLCGVGVALAVASWVLFRKR